MRLSFINRGNNLSPEALLRNQKPQAASLRLQAVTDQHAAMTEELETLASVTPTSFTLEQVWTLIRAIKVQSQVLQLYVGQPFEEVN